MRKLYPVWLQAMFSEFTPLQMSRGFSIESPAYDKTTNSAVLRPVAIKGTRLTQRKLSALIDGRRPPSKSDTHKLRLLWRRYAYRSLRAAGCPAKHARRYDRSPVPVLTSVIERYNRTTKAFAELRETTQLAIQYSLGRSDVGPEENLRKRMMRSGLKDWRGIIDDRELDAIIEEFMGTDVLAEIDEDVEQY